MILAIVYAVGIVVIILGCATAPNILYGLTYSAISKLQTDVDNYPNLYTQLQKEQIKGYHSGTVAFCFLLILLITLILITITYFYLKNKQKEQANQNTTGKGKYILTFLNTETTETYSKINIEFFNDSNRDYQIYASNFEFQTNGELLTNELTLDNQQNQYNKLVKKFSKTTITLKIKTKIDMHNTQIFFKGLELKRSESLKIYPNE